MKPLIIGSRGSHLALTQSNHIADCLRALNPDRQIEVTIIQTQGDRILDAPLSRIGGKGVFTREIEIALLERRIDIAVHSLKDLPTKNTEGLTVAAIPPRESALDVLITPVHRELSSFGKDDVIGTSSLRRAAQLRARFPEVSVVELRGNVPTRLRKMNAESLSAIVLAEAGIRRLGLTPNHMQPLYSEVMLSAPGQGALGIQARDDDEEILALLRRLNDPATTACCLAERTLLDRLGGGCQVPLGAYAECIDNNRIRLRGRVISMDGTQQIDCDLYGSISDPEALGARAAEELRANGAVTIIESAVSVSLAQSDEQPTHDAKAEAKEVRVVVTRDEDADGPLSRELRAQGLVPVCLPLIRVRAKTDLSAMEAACEEGFDWIVFSSSNSVEALQSLSGHAKKYLAESKVAAVGPSTAASIHKLLGIQPILVGDSGRDELIEKLLPLLGERPCRVLVPMGNLTPMVLSSALREAGHQVVAIEVYETVREEKNIAVLRSLIARRECDVISFCSSSAVDAFAEAFPNLPNDSIKFASIGESTTKTAESHGMTITIKAHQATFSGMASAIRDATPIR